MTLDSEQSGYVAAQVIEVLQVQHTLEAIQGKPSMVLIRPANISETLVEHYSLPRVTFPTGPDDKYFLIPPTSDKIKIYVAPSLIM